jgi:hypothetical protein
MQTTAADREFMHAEAADDLAILWQDLGGSD